ncbi:hypothetical protein BMS3Abin15_00433 [bacterium BMS3Abin15]|nr:hypothetical protein BMS3Abin15_00433 [bacterium BMS3Abin15]HDZ85047.1 hypothetical protein [Candidatus Moranbacteria bacterium]
MVFLIQQEIELLCPDNETTRNCHGRIKVNLTQYRIARGRGAFIIAVDTSKSDKFTCNRCGRKFKFENPTSKLPELFFVPAKKSR